MTPKELVKLLKKNGWYLYQHSANHDQYRHPDKSISLLVERHGKDIATGTLNQLLKDAGLK